MQVRGYALRGWLGVTAFVVALGAGAVLIGCARTPDGEKVTTPGLTKSSASAPTSAVASSQAVPAAGRVDSIAEEEAREASWREAREASIRVQQRLRAEQRARESEQQAAAKDFRCVDGQRMKRVENGWIQAGNC
jgi:hypothetical protein